MLQIQHIQHYPIGGENALNFPEGRLVGLDIEDKERILHIRDPKNGLKYGYSLSDIKPFLRPLSDLFKEQNGKIDIIELAKIAVKWDWKLGKYKDYDNTYIDVAEFYSSIFFYNEKYKLFQISSSCEQNYIAFNQLALFQYLLDRHYDVFALIEKGLAIDLNTVEL